MLGYSITRTPATIYRVLDLPYWATISTLGITLALANLI